MIKTLLLLFAFTFPQLLSAQTTAALPRSFLFLGNSITYAGDYITDIELCYTLWHPGRANRFINIGLPSETVSGLSEPGHADGQFPRPDLHERLSRILSQVKPDVIIACYGMNDGIYLPFDKSRFEKYKAGIQWLHDTLQATHARVIMLTPPVYDELRGHAKGYAAVLDIYARWLLSKRSSAHWEVADIHFPMKKYLEAHRRVDAAFGVDGFALAADGIHPAETGHWLMARQLLLFLGEKKAAAYASIQKVAMAHTNGKSILKLLSEKQNIMKDAWLTATGHLRPGMKTGLPMKEAESKAAALDKQIKDYL